MSYLIATLQYALSRKRPYKGKGEAALRVFVRRMVGGASTIDDAGNLIIDRRQRQDGGTSRTLFVAHMDTVHREDGRNTFVQDRAKRILKADGAPLGADDGAGVAMLVHLLKHGVPGLYVFTVGEEVGGVGAKYFARTQKDVLTNEIDRAIAFDRRGGTSVITHQSCGKCASPEFAEALSEKLSNANDALLYMPDDTGVYTDTAEFVDMVAECTNISVGYECEHGDKESLDMAHFEALADGVLKFDWDTLPVVRTPGDDGYARGAWGAWGAWGKAGSWYGTTGNWNDVWDAEDDRANMCTREQRFALYDALDFAADGHCAQLRDLLQEYVDAEYEGASLDELYEARGIVNEGRCDAELIDAMYEAADASPGDEVWSACAAGYELLLERECEEKRAELAAQQRH